MSVGGTSALSPFGVKYLLAKWKSVHYAWLRCQARKRAQDAPVKGPRLRAGQAQAPLCAAREPRLGLLLERPDKDLLVLP